MTAPLAEIIEEGKRAYAKRNAIAPAVEDEWQMFILINGPRLLAVAEAAMEMRRVYDYAIPILFEGPGGTSAEIEADTMMCEADAAFDSAVRGAK